MNSDELRTCLAANLSWLIHPLIPLEIRKKQTQTKRLLKVVLRTIDRQIYRKCYLQQRDDELIVTAVVRN